MYSDIIEEFVKGIRNLFFLLVFAIIALIVICFWQGSQLREQPKPDVSVPVIRNQLPLNADGKPVR